MRASLALGDAWRTPPRQLRATPGAIATGAARRPAKARGRRAALACARKKTPAVGDGGRFVASAGLARPNAGDAGRRYSCAPVAPPCAADHSAGACRNFSTSSSVFVSK
ncbi:hypothetical protein DP49_5450 [Burkholderia pseudomallei]|nr:hypothetical protein DP49_5450 [Burkholderia pseudomallei]